MRKNFHYNNENNFKNKNYTNENKIKQAQEENKKLKMELNQKNNVLKDYNSRIKSLQEELHHLQRQKNNNIKNNDNFQNNYFDFPNDQFFNDNQMNSPFRNGNILNFFFEDIIPRRNINRINPNFNPGDYEDYYEDKNINNHINNNFNYNNNNDESKIEQDIIDQLYPDPDKMTYEQLLELEEKVGSVSKGLNKAQIKKIPRFIYQKHIHKNIDNKCVVCQYEFKNGETVTQLTCGHLFHSECVDTWLSKNKVCPMCHKEIIIR
jgi:hypothetical protein